MLIYRIVFIASYTFQSVYCLDIRFLLPSLLPGPDPAASCWRRGMFNSKFNKWAKQPDLDLFPKELEDAAAKANEWIYPNINNGVYR